MATSWYDRLAELSEQAKESPHRVGMDSMLLLEDWLYEQAKTRGYRKPHSSMREYLEYISRSKILSREERARIERYAEVRNCLSHRSGLLMSASLTNELLDFLGRLFRRNAMTAEELMTRHPYTVTVEDRVHEARDWMLENNISRLPVVDEKKHVVGLLTNRDLLTITANKNGTEVEALTVGEAMSADALEKIAFLPRAASYETVVDALQRKNVAAVFITDNGRSNEQLLGLVAVSDILPKL